MRVNVCIGERSVSYDVPDGFYVVGISLYRDDNSVNMNLFSNRDEQKIVELINEDGCRVVVRYDAGPFFDEVADILNEFKGLSLYECRCEKMSLSVVL